MNSKAAQLTENGTEIVRRARDGRVRTNIGNVATLDDAVAAFNRTERIKGKTIIRVHPEDSGLPNAHEGAIHAPKESLDVEHDSKSKRKG